MLRERTLIAVVGISWIILVIAAVISGIQTRVKLRKREHLI